MIFNGTAHPIHILDKMQLNNSRGDEFSLKDSIEEVNIIKTLDLNLELNIHTTNSINPYIGKYDGIDIYMPDMHRIANIDFAPNFQKYDKIIVSSMYVNKILQYCIHNMNFFQYNFEYLNKLYVVYGTVKKEGKIIGCVGLKKVFGGRNLETIYKLYNSDLNKVDVSELVIALMEFRSRFTNDEYMNLDYVKFVNDYINENGISFEIHSNSITD